MRYLRLPLVGLALALFSVTTVAAAGDARLADAARRGDKAAVLALLKQKADVNAPQPDGTTALHFVASGDDLELAGALIRAGARVDAANDYGVTPLSLAATRGHAAMIDVLLEAGANPNLGLPTGETPLMTVSRTGTVDAVRALLARGADVNAKDPAQGQTALMWAVADDHLDAARLLLANGADVQARTQGGFTPLMFAARQGNLAMVQLLLDAGAAVNDADGSGNSVLVVATVRGHADVARFLLAKGADPNADGSGFTALHWASAKVELTEFPTRYGPWHEWGVLGGVVNGRTELIKTLLAHGANVNARLTKAPPRFSNEGGSYNSPGSTPLIVAAGCADLDTMRLLLAHGADPMARTTDNQTALIAAIGRPTGDAQDAIPEAMALEAVRLALTFGIDPNATDNLGESALHTAAFIGREPIIELLVASGADVNLKSKRNNETPLRVAMGVERGALKFPGYPRSAEILRKLGGKPE